MQFSSAQWVIAAFALGLWMVPAEAETGIASWYGPGFHGRMTACGHRYDMNAPGAAHRHLPCGSWVRVTDLKTGRAIVVRVVDRGPYFRGRIIDLSKQSARRLFGSDRHGRPAKGLARVRVERVR